MLVEQAGRPPFMSGLLALPRALCTIALKQIAPSGSARPPDPTFTPPAAIMPQEHVFLLHGMFGRPEHWSACAAHLAGRWHTHTPRVPVLDVVPDNRAIEALGDGIIRDMDAMGIGRAVIGGNSLGGHIAARMALCHPDRVCGLVLTGSSGLFERGFERKVPRRPTESYMRGKMREIFYDPVHVTDDLVREVGIFLSDFRNAVHMVRLAKCAKHDSLRAFLPAMACPVLLVWGENDQITPPAVAHEFLQLLPDAELHMIERCGHVPMVECPAIFNDKIESFLSRISRENEPSVRPLCSA